MPNLLSGHFTVMPQMVKLTVARHNLLITILPKANQHWPSKDDTPNLNLIASNFLGLSGTHQFQDLLSEVRQIQKLLQSTGERSGRDTAKVPLGNANSIRTDDLTGFWDTIAEERQQRLQLDHSLRQMELDVLEVKTQVQSCKARFQNYQPSASPHWNCCPPKFCCSPTHEMVKHCYCVDEIPVPHSKLRSSTSLFTLV